MFERQKEFIMIIEKDLSIDNHRYLMMTARPRATKATPPIAAYPHH